MTKSVKMVLEDARAAQRMVVVFLLDCTASMGPWIQEVQKKIKSIVDAYEQFYGRSSIFFGFVGYRDHGISEPFKYPIDANLEEFKKFVSAVEAHSQKDPKWNGEHLDQPEDVAGGLHMARHLNWDIAGAGTSRVLIHIADAPAHGQRYNGGLTDRYNNSAAPFGKDPAITLDQLKKHVKVHYYFCKIKDDTDTMVKMFNEDVGSKSWIETVDMKDATKLAGTVLRTLCSSVMKTVQSNGNAIGGDLSTNCTTLSTISEGDAEDLAEEAQSRPEGTLQEVDRNTLNWGNISSQSIEITALANVERLSDLQQRYTFMTC